MFYVWFVLFWHVCWSEHFVPTHQHIHNRSLTNNIWTIEPIIERSYLTSFKNSKFRKGDNIENWNFLRNKKIVMIGDSRTRYQFMYFIHHIRTSRWADGDFHHLCCEKIYPNWESFYSAFSSIFGCSLICDCRRPILEPNKFPLAHENHHFYDEELDLHVDFYFIGNIGMSHYQGMPSSQEFQHFCHNFLSLAPEYVKKEQNYTWLYSNASTLMNEVLIKQKIDILILHPSHSLTYELEYYYSAMQRVAPIHVYKVSTLASDAKKSLPETPEFLESLHKRGFKIFDTNQYTRDIVKVHGMMWDPSHFSGFVNRELNIALLEEMEGWITGHDERGGGH